MKEIPNIDELLNSFIDGELTQRHQTEVQRLISHDPRVAQRVRELQKTKMLVSSLPTAEAPADMAERVKASLEKMPIPREQPSRFDQRKGARYLLVRKVLAAAAMIGLVAVLTVVVYTIVAPEKLSPATGFKARLELKTSNLPAVDSAINKAIENSGLSGFVSPRRQGNKSVYAITCSRDALGLFLADMQNVWRRFDSATLFVDAKPPGKQVVVNDVKPEQIANLITPVKPKLTGPEKTSETPPGQPEKTQKIHLTIVVAGSE